MVKKNQIWKIYGTDFKEMTKKLLEETGLEQLILSRAEQNHSEKDGRDSRQLCIGIKPNLVTPTPADFGATTHPEIVAGIVEYLQAHQFENIVITEGSWVGDRTQEAYELCGYRELCESYNVPFIDTQKQKWHSRDCAGMKLNITDVTEQIDFLINVPVMKGHCQTKMTCALKNLKGLLPNKEKSRFHTMGLHKPIAHLQTAVRQDFIVVDHICGDLDFEEGGNPVVRNCIMAAADPVLVDSYVCYLMGYTPEDVPYIRMAEALGIGSTDIDAAEFVTLDVEVLNNVRGAAAGDKARGAESGKKAQGTESGDKAHKVGSGDSADGTRMVTPRSTIGPGNGAEEEELPREHKLLEVSYAVDAVESCSACYANLVGALWRLKEEDLLEKVPTPIGIGQGMQGKTGKLGIGKCTKDFDVCIMGCPPDEEKIYQKLKELALAR